MTLSMIGKWSVTELHLYFKISLVNLSSEIQPLHSSEENNTIMAREANVSINKIGPLS